MRECSERPHPGVQASQLATKLEAAEALSGDLLFGGLGGCEGVVSGGCDRDECPKTFVCMHTPKLAMGGDISEV